MVVCVNEGCGKELVKWQKKFCSSSCSAKVNNVGVRRHGRSPSKCLSCGGETISHTRKCCSLKCYQDYRYTERIECWKKTGKFPGRRAIKRYFLEQQNNRCKICNILNDWEERELIFVLDHIDGNSSNNSEKNLRLLCPNCDSQIDTFKGKNLGNGRHYRRVRYAEGKSF